MAQLGRISGPMLDLDLLRNGSNLSFKNNSIDTSLLYFDVVNRRVGVNTETPVDDLEVVGGIKFTDLTIINPQTYGNLTVANGSISVVSGNLTIGTTAGQTILPGMITEDYIFDGNRITSLNSDANLELVPDGTGEIDLIGSVNIHQNMNITGTVTLTGNIDISGNVLTLGNESSDTIDFNTEFDQDLLVGLNNAYNLGSIAYTWKNLFSSQYQNNDISVQNNIIETTDTNLNLQSLGVVTFENVTMTDNNIDTISDSLSFNAFSNIVEFASTSSLKLPTGTAAQRILTNSSIRFNTDDTLFEVYTNGVGRLGGIYSTDIQTQVTAHPTENFLTFRTNSGISGGINNSNSNFIAVEVDDIGINNSTISSINSNADLEFQTTGTGHIEFNSNFIFLDNEWINESDAASIINVTSGGRVKFNSQSAVTIPSGDTATRPTVVETGMTRFNTELGYIETYNGSNWIPTVGVDTPATQEDIDELRFKWTLILG